MVALWQLLFLISLVVLISTGIPHLRQKPLRARGERVMAEERSRKATSGGRLSIQYAYLDRSGNEYTKWRRGVSTEPAGPLVGVVYDLRKPTRAEFTARMPENPGLTRVRLLSLVVVTAVAFVLSRVVQPL